ncbi:N-acetylmuramoyl-L-alanine amidase family protein, partial [Clostridiaceae bacterium]|nr:N-acetylmuramoyl-L-alanine amidase family protein [Clostridiaceae bacterium]
MKRIFQKLSVIFLVLSLAVLLPATALAASRPINKVSVRVDSKLEAGSTLPDIGIGDGSPEKGGVRV